MDQNEKRALAHEMALRLISINHYFASTPHHVAMSAWDYADAMEKEELKRTDKTRPDVLADPLVAPVHQVDWNDAPDWARYLFFCGRLGSATWSECEPFLKTSEGRTRLISTFAGLSEKAANKYSWVKGAMLFSRGGDSA